MAEAIHNLAVILKNHPQPQNDAEFLLVKQTRPPKFNDEEYDSYVDSDLWDLPSTQLNLLDGNSESPIVLEGAQSINLTNFDLHSALTKVNPFSFSFFFFLFKFIWKLSSKCYIFTIM